MAATPTNPETLNVLVVYENKKNDTDIQWLKSLNKSWKQENPLVKLIPAHAIDFELDLLEELNPIEVLLRDQRSTSGKTPTSAFVKHVRKYFISEDGELLPVIIVALGFAALVAMKAVVSEPNFTPMGMIVASVSEETATGKSVKFRDWHKKLAEEDAESKRRRVGLDQLSKNRRATLVEELAKKDVLTKKNREAIEKHLTDKEDPAFSALKKVLREFNDHCRHERIRLSYVFRNQEASHNRWC